MKCEKCGSEMIGIGSYMNETKVNFEHWYCDNCKKIYCENKNEYF